MWGIHIRWIFPLECLLLSSLLSVILSRSVKPHKNLCTDSTSRLKNELKSTTSAKTPEMKSPKDRRKTENRMESVATNLIIRFSFFNLATSSVGKWDSGKLLTSSIESVATPRALNASFASSVYWSNVFLLIFLNWSNETKKSQLINRQSKRFRLVSTRTRHRGMETPIRHEPTGLYVQFTKSFEVTFAVG